MENNDKSYTTDTNMGNDLVEPRGSEELLIVAIREFEKTNSHYEAQAKALGEKFAKHTTDSERAIRDFETQARALDEGFNNHINELKRTIENLETQGKGLEENQIERAKEAERVINDIRNSIVEKIDDSKTVLMKAQKKIADQSEVNHAELLNGMLLDSKRILGSLEGNFKINHESLEKNGKELAVKVEGSKSEIICRIEKFTENKLSKIVKIFKKWMVVLMVINLICLGYIIYLLNTTGLRSGTVGNPLDPAKIQTMPAMVTSAPNTPTMELTTVTKTQRNHTVENSKPGILSEESQATHTDSVPGVHGNSAIEKTKPRVKFEETQTTPTNLLPALEDLPKIE